MKGQPTSRYVPLWVGKVCKLLTLITNLFSEFYFILCVKFCYFMILNASWWGCMGEGMRLYSGFNKKSFSYILIVGKSGASLLYPEYMRYLKM